MATRLLPKFSMWIGDLNLGAIKVNLCNAASNNTKVLPDVLIHILSQAGEEPSVGGRTSIASLKSRRKEFSR